MRIPRLRRGMVIALAGIEMAATAAGAGAAAPRGDPTAKAEVIAAFQRLNARRAIG